MKYVILLLSLAAFPAVAYGEVIDKSTNGFTSVHELVLQASPARAYEALTRDVHLWWDASHSFGGDAAGFTMEPTAGGCFCEKLADGGSVQHMQIVNAQPGRSLTLRGGIGPLQAMGVAGAMTFAFKPHPEGALLSYRYVVGGYVDGGLAPLAEPVDQVQLGQLQRLQQFLATNAPLN